MGAPNAEAIFARFRLSSSGRLIFGELGSGGLVCDSESTDGCKARCSLAVDIDLNGEISRDENRRYNPAKSKHVDTNTVSTRLLVIGSELCSIVLGVRYKRAEVAVLFCRIQHHGHR